MLSIGELPIDRFIENSGIYSSWVNAKWFGNPRARQVLTCGDMKRAMITHEVTLVVLHQFCMEQFIKENPNLFIGSRGRIFQTIKEIQDAFDMHNFDTVKMHEKFETLLLEENFVKKLEKFEKERKFILLFNCSGSSFI